MVMSLVFLSLWMTLFLLWIHAQSPHFIDTLFAKFDIKDLHNLYYFLAIEATPYKQESCTYSNKIDFLAYA